MARTRERERAEEHREAKGEKEWMQTERARSPSIFILSRSRAIFACCRRCSHRRRRRRCFCCCCWLHIEPKSECASMLVWLHWMDIEGIFASVVRLCVCARFFYNYLNKSESMNSKSLSAQYLGVCEDGRERALTLITRAALLSSLAPPKPSEHTKMNRLQFAHSMRHKIHINIVIRLSRARSPFGSTSLSLSRSLSRSLSVHHILFFLFILAVYVLLFFSFAFWILFFAFVCLFELANRTHDVQNTLFRNI